MWFLLWIVTGILTQISLSSGCEVEDLVHKVLKDDGIYPTSLEVNRNWNPFTEDGRFNIYQMRRGENSFIIYSVRFSDLEANGRFECRVQISSFWEGEEGTTSCDGDVKFSVCTKSSSDGTAISLPREQDRRELTANELDWFRSNLELPLSFIDTKTGNIYQCRSFKTGKNVPITACSITPLLGYHSIFGERFVSIPNEPKTKWAR